MAATTLSAVILAVAVLAPSVLANHCDDERGITHFDPSYLCGQTFYIPYTSYKAQEIDCAFGRCICGNDGSISFETYVRRNGVLNFTSTSDLTALIDRSGVISRKYSNSDVPTLMIAKAYTEFLPDERGVRHFKFAYIVCRKNTDNILAKVILVSSLKSSVRDEQVSLQTAYEDEGLALIPNTCHAEEYFDS